MHYITDVLVEKFWETYDFEFQLKRDCTFFIGQNGTGKTTLINLIAAVLTADIRTLHKIPFKRVSIAFADTSRKERPKVIVSKSFSKRAAIVEVLEYRIVGLDASGKEIKYSLDEESENVLMHRYRFDEMPVEYYRRMTVGLLPELRKLYSVNWLSINRVNTAGNSRDDKQFESTIDRKIDSLTSELGKYFATLSKRKDDEVRLFQESIFMSLLEVDEAVAPLDLRITGNLEVYEATLKTIFTELHVSSRNAETVIDAFINRAKSLDQSFFTPRSRNIARPSFTGLDDAVFAAGFNKVVGIVSQWEDLQGRLKDIFSTRDRYQLTINNLLQRKRMEVTETNELQFISRSEKALTPYMLSSGEKQLLILLSEALLQREQNTIYIADEPELSLHVLWQEKLIDSISALNPNAQLIIATHSPDVVGNREYQAIDMEELIQ
jgi:predicted ATPase